MLTRLALTSTSRSFLGSVASKAFFGSVSPATDPLSLIHDECLKRNLCDEYGTRRPGAHWVFSLAVTPDDIHQVGIFGVAITGMGRESSFLVDRHLFYRINFSFIATKYANDWHPTNFPERH